METILRIPRICRACAATGKIHDEAEKNMYKAIKMHVEGLMEDCLPGSKSHTTAEYVVINK